MTPARTTLAALAVAAYITAIAGANWATDTYGLIPIAPGLTTTAGTLAAGAALLLRDTVQDTAGRRWVLAGIAAGAALTWTTAPALAIASATAFLVAELADMAVYTPLRTQGWARAALTSGAVGAVVDTWLFLWLAGFPLTASVVGGQLVGKVAWATALPVALVVAARWGVTHRAVPRDTVRA
ncbi:VUT family protein [Streptomyces sp. 3MP-14]|uniref:VUT family protein n=1 Tax=Streptomyces mimosae TaxID=2586635 RepID=A0A5N6A3W8_9ACTN|nr:MULTISPECIES: VUT family protein [Streptomyces]KAB8162942.1 VUT family protein [Streptomyces mimosae]KAB8179156.1 VUT family protein [Streptomyces sp. 3MP-14]